MASTLGIAVSASTSATSTNGMSSFIASFSVRASIIVTKGTLVGFFFPESMSGVDFAGYPLHFLTDDHSAGGHLLDCVVADAVVELDVINSYNLILS